MNGESIIAEARAWLGTPWRHQGRLRGIGVDCIGLIGGVALALDLPGAREWRDTPAFHNYGRQPDPAVLLAGCDLLMDAVPRAEARHGDVLILRFEKEPQHFAFLATDRDYPTLVHALALSRRVVEQRYDAVWRSRLVAAYRFREA